MVAAPCPLAPPVSIAGVEAGCGVSTAAEPVSDVLRERGEHAIAATMSGAAAQRSRRAERE